VGGLYSTAPRTRFEPVTYRLTVSLPQKYLSIDLLQPEKPVHINEQYGSTKKLSGHNRTEPVVQCPLVVVYHMKWSNNNFGASI